MSDGSFPSLVKFCPWSRELIKLSLWGLLPSEYLLSRGGSGTYRQGCNTKWDPVFKEVTLLTRYPDVPRLYDLFLLHDPTHSPLQYRPQHLVTQSWLDNWGLLEAANEVQCMSHFAVLSTPYINLNERLPPEWIHCFFQGTFAAYSVGKGGSPHYLWTYLSRVGALFCAKKLHVL